MYNNNESDGRFWAWNDAEHTGGKYIEGVLDTDCYLYDAARWVTKQPPPTPSPSPPPESKTPTQASVPGPIRRKRSNAARSKPYPKQDEYTKPNIQTKLPTTAIRRISPRAKADKKRNCLECGALYDTSETCDQRCFVEFHNTTLQPAKNLLELRDAGAMGYGVFVKKGCKVPANIFLGAYLGELLPMNDPQVEASSYIFQLFSLQGKKAPKDVAIDAAARGNWTRFLNSHCIPNLAASTEMIGGMTYIMFNSLRTLYESEQLFYAYGPDYFEGACLCDWKKAPHIPPPLIKR